MSNESGKYTRATVLTGDDFEYYDQLPPKIRSLIQDAPYKLHSQNIQKLIAHLGLSEIAQRLPIMIQEVVKESSALTYGPDHPQAQ